MNVKLKGGGREELSSRPDDESGTHSLHCLQLINRQRNMIYHTVLPHIVPCTSRNWNDCVGSAVPLYQQIKTAKSANILRNLPPHAASVYRTAKPKWRNSRDASEELRHSFENKCWFILLT